MAAGRCGPSLNCIGLIFWGIAFVRLKSTEAAATHAPITALAAAMAFRKASIEVQDAARHET